MSTIQLPDDHSHARARILETAERLFADKGFQATSVREITSAAEVNIASVSYYFGGKEGLYQEVVRRVLVDLREVRIQRLEADLEAAGPDATLEDFLESFARAFIEPLVGGDRSKGFISIFDQEMLDPRVPQELFFEQLVLPMLETTRTCLGRVGIELDKATCGLCLMSLVGQLIHVLKAQKRLFDGAGSNPFPDDLEGFFPHFVQFSAAGIRACHSQGEAN